MPGEQQQPQESYADIRERYPDLLPKMVPMRRLLYGEWLPDECEACHTREDVQKFADASGKEKKPIYLCRKCAEPGIKHLREWTEERDEVVTHSPHADRSSTDVEAFNRIVKRVRGWE